RSDWNERARPALGRNANSREHAAARHRNRYCRAARCHHPGPGRPALVTHTSDSPPAPGRIRVAVADDHPVVREGLVGMLETQSDFTVVGEASTGAGALALIARADPD